MDKLLIFVGVAAAIYFVTKDDKPQGGTNPNPNPTGRYFRLPDGRTVDESMLPSLGYQNINGQWYPANQTPTGTNWLQLATTALTAGVTIYSALAGNTKVLKRGVTGNEVTLLQKKLNELRPSKPGGNVLANLAEDGNFGAATEDRLRSWYGIVEIQAKDVPNLR